ncbi:hypothetical protein JTB14_005523 [Gonioctena quinquepunctata]|nr:hypothetical protein JTB14_005523 [Gonioctena quinquepunctata]
MWFVSMASFIYKDQQDSDQDDAPSDEEGLPSIRDIRKGILKQSMEVYTISTDGERTIPQSDMRDNPIQSDGRNSENETSKQSMEIHTISKADGRTILQSDVRDNLIHSDESESDNENLVAIQKRLKFE